MKKLNKKWIIGISVISVLVVVLVIAIILGNSNSKTKEIENEKGNENNNQTITNEYTAYVSINPLLKLNFKEICTSNGAIEEGNKNYNCEKPIVTLVTLENDDAKEIYKDIDFGYNSDLGSVLGLIGKTAADNDIVFDTVTVYTDWGKIKTYIDNNQEKTEWNWSYTVNIVNKEDIDSGNVINKEVIYVVSYNSDGGNKISNESVERGNTATKPSNPTKSGYTFVEWQLNGKAYDFSTPVNKDIELKAKWKKNNEPIPTVKYTVSFNSNGGSTISNQVVVNGSKVKKPNNPSRTGYTFVEWQLNGKSYDFNTSVNSNIELLAIWDKVNEPTPTVKYKVLFNASEGDTIDIQVVESGSKATKPSNPTKSGYTFVEWQLNGKAYDFNTPVNSNIELIATWNKNPYDYNLNDNMFYGYAWVQFVIPPSQSKIDELKSHGFIPTFDSDSFEYNDWDVSSSGDYNWYENNFKYEEIPVSTLSKIKKIKGVKFIEYDNQNVLTLEVMDRIYAGNTDETLYYNVSNWNESTNGVIRLGSFGNEDPTLLDEKACKEYNLSCGRW